MRMSTQSWVVALKKYEIRESTQKEGTTKEKIGNGWWNLREL